MAQWSKSQVKRRVKKAEAEKSAANTIYREAMDLYFPDRNIIDGRVDGEQKPAINWDGQAQISLIRSANRYSSDFTPQSSPFYEIELGPAVKLISEEVFANFTGGKSKKQVIAELEASTAITQAVFQGPGFATTSHEVYLDYQIGMGGMMMMPNEDLIGPPVIFTSMPLGTFWPQKGPNGIVDKWFFWDTQKADDIQRMWKDAKLGQLLTEKAAMTDPPDVDLCIICYRDHDIKEKKDRPFRYEVHAKISDNKNERIVSRQYISSPFITPRNMVLAGENMGRGPGIFALPDVRTANKIVELTLRSAMITVGGIWTSTDDALVNDAQSLVLKPHSVIKVRSNGGPQGPSLMRLENPSTLGFGEVLLEKLHENIKKVLGDNSLPSEAGPVRSATEFERIRELIADAAGGLGRLHGEFVVPAVQRCVDILDSKQLMPAGLAVDIDQFLIRVKMTSPLAKAEAMNEVQNLINFVELLGQVGGPEFQHLMVNMESIMDDVAELMDIDQRHMNPQPVREKLKATAAELKAQEAGAEPGAATAEVQRLEKQGMEAAA